MIMLQTDLRCNVYAARDPETPETRVQMRSLQRSEYKEIKDQFNSSTKTRQGGSARLSFDRTC